MQKTYNLSWNGQRFFREKGFNLTDIAILLGHANGSNAHDIQSKLEIASEVYSQSEEKMRQTFNRSIEEVAKAAKKEGLLQEDKSEGKFGRYEGSFDYYLMIFDEKPKTTDKKISPEAQKKVLICRLAFMAGLITQPEMEQLIKRALNPPAPARYLGM